ncbi:RlmE family RNA methyltransferase [Buchnera aphidicola]|uniref:RlmE family RNA methyltransferase n=1 Tax=Buchnera aphidicola TaxID=9 RepID=UPI002091F00B|nr:RlmE family RNA methyltransferase [Buchnera aphidicola]USS94375.1 RlmE family RNA methyltransferase [Buchnera aphidicola (Sipha maydis)]WII23536.1 RlmE family RNA methyltransferase [Buchnera aphidicola (Sipha maydis)]
MTKKKNPSSKFWLRNYFQDIYVRKAHEKNFRSRAWFKIDEINKKFNVFRNCNTILDIGSSPGSWSEYAVNQVGCNKNIIACDISFMKPIAGVKFIQGDVENYKTYLSIVDNLKNKKVDLLMSDLSPKTTGHVLIDVHKSIYLSKIALNLSQKLLSKKGFFITKVFQGGDSDLYFQCIKKNFFQVKVYKPCASRSQSREIFFIAKNIKNNIIM